MEGKYLAAQDMCQQKCLCIYAHKYTTCSPSFSGTNLHTAWGVIREHHIMKHLIDTADSLLPVNSPWLWLLTSRDSHRKWLFMTFDPQYPETLWHNVTWHTLLLTNPAGLWGFFYHGITEGNSSFHLTFPDIGKSVHAPRHTFIWSNESAESCTLLFTEGQLCAFGWHSKNNYCQNCSQPLCLSVSLRYFTLIFPSCTYLYC